MELVNGVVDALVHGFHPPVHIDLALELAGMVDAGLGLQLVDQLAALPLGDEAGGLDRVHQQLQLRQLEGALPQKPAR